VAGGEVALWIGVEHAGDELLARPRRRGHLEALARHQQPLVKAFARAARHPQPYQTPVASARPRQSFPSAQKDKNNEPVRVNFTNFLAWPWSVSSKTWRQIAAQVHAPD